MRFESVVFVAMAEMLYILVKSSICRSISCTSSGACKSGFHMLAAAEAAVPLRF